MTNVPVTAPETAVLRMRLRADDTHYATGTIPGATYLALMADAGAMLSILRGDPAGFLARWESVDFTAPCHVGDYIEVRARLLRTGNRSRQMDIEVVRLIRTSAEPETTTIGELLDPPEPVARGTYIAVVPKSQAS